MQLIWSIHRNRAYLVVDIFSTCTPRTKQERYVPTQTGKNSQTIRERVDFGHCAEWWCLFGTGQNHVSLHPSQKNGMADGYNMNSENRKTQPPKPLSDDDREQ